MAETSLQDILGIRWWAVALRGAIAVLFGILCFTTPVAAIMTLVLLFAIYSIGDGLIALFASFGAARKGERWIGLGIEAVASIAIGVLTLIWPHITIAAFLIIIAVKTLFSGVLLIISSFKLDEAHGRIWMLLAGIASLAFTVLLVMAPLTGGTVLTWWIGIYAIVFGVALIVLGFFLRNIRNAVTG